MKYRYYVVSMLSGLTVFCAQATIPAHAARGAELNVKACHGKQAGDACLVSGGVAQFMAQGTCKVVTHPTPSGTAQAPVLACSLR